MMVELKYSLMNKDVLAAKMVIFVAVSKKVGSKSGVTVADNNNTVLRMMKSTTITSLLTILFPL